jgi:hypothetical protein
MKAHKTAALSLPFSLFREFSDSESEVVLQRGKTSNRLVYALKVLGVTGKGGIPLYQ